MWHQSSIWTTKLLPDLWHMLPCRYVCLSQYSTLSRLISGFELHFNLQTAGSWSSVYGGFDYLGLYNYVVDFFENTPRPAAKKRTQELLNWWSMWVFQLLTNIRLNSRRGRKIFPAAAVHRQSNTSASRKRFKEQRAALEREEAWAAFVFWRLSFPPTVLHVGHRIFKNYMFWCFHLCV